MPLPLPAPSTALPTASFERIVDDLAERGWSAVPGFLPRPAVSALAAEEQALWSGGGFREAGVGRGGGQGVHAEIRSDRICWLDPAALPPATAAYWDLVGALRQTLNRTLFLGLQRFEAHYALYPVGSFYKRHLDQHRGSPHRTVTCLLYLNEDWRPEDAGALRLYTPTAEGETATDVYPEAGTFVCFRSDLIPHEVLPTRRARMSLTGWLRRDAA